jgi:hypothetical protein
VNTCFYNVRHVQVASSSTTHPNNRPYLDGFGAWPGALETQVFTPFFDTLIWSRFAVMNLFLLKNPTQAKMAVQLEPWAEVYYLRKGDTLKLTQDADLEGYYHIIFYEADSVSVLVEGFLDYPLVFINDQVAEPWNDFTVYPSE